MIQQLQNTIAGPSAPELFDEVYTIVCLGRMGSGKTAKSMKMLDQFHNDGWETCFCPGNDKPVPGGLLPPWMHQCSPLNPRFVENTVYLFDDWHLVRHSREWRDEISIAIQRTETKNRQFNRKFIFNTQHSKQIDTSQASWNVGATCFNKHSLRQAKSERQEVKEMALEASRAFRHYEDLGYNYKELIYIFTDAVDENLEGKGEMFKMSLPDWWSEGLSTYLSGTKKKRNL